MQTRIEHDTMGEIEVPNEALWGAQTQRSLQNFKIGQERLPRAMIRAMGLVKSSGNNQCRVRPVTTRFEPIYCGAAEEVIAGKWDSQFPLVVWQTGSGTQSNMNCNEVIANIANQKLGQALGAQKPYIRTIMLTAHNLLMTHSQRLFMLRQVCKLMNY